MPRKSHVKTDTPSRSKPHRKRLDERSVLNLGTRRRAYRVWDVGPDAARGLHILVQPTGTRSYRVRYRFKGSPTEHNLLIGRVGVVSLEEARAKAFEVHRAAARGDDPAAGDPVRSDTFKVCVETWTQNEQQGRKECASAEATKVYLLTACERWHNRPIGTLRYAEIDDLLSAKRRQAPYSAVRIHAHLKTMFKWCVRTQRIAVSPMAEMPKPWLGAKARSRPWFEGEKADAVIASLWHAADELGGAAGRFIKLLLITGKRRRAIETIRWDHIDKHWYWRPTIGTKTKRCHPIPLPKLAQRVLSPRGDEGRVLGPLDIPGLSNQVRKMIELPDFIWHGVRHMVETKLGELRVQPHIRDMLLDHAPVRGSGKDYDHGTYRAEQLEALEIWCAHIERLVAPAQGVAVLR